MTSVKLVFQDRFLRGVLKFSFISTILFWGERCGKKIWHVKMISSRITSCFESTVFIALLVSLVSCKFVKLHINIFALGGINLLIHSCLE